MSFSSPRPASISIDFGTSHTVATIRRADGRVHQQLFDGSPQLPSAVFMNDEGGPVVGADAVHSGRRKPDRYEPNPKRRIDDAEILLGETEIPVTSVIAAVLSRVARECEQTLGSLGPVTVTVPAAWGPTRRHVVADAATAAGLGTVDLVAEPVAAAGYFVGTLGTDVPPGSGVVVYDLGGGTFDATVLRRATTGFDVLAVDGASDLGGLDFDQALAEHVAKSVQPDDERWQRLLNPVEPADLRHRTAFMDEVRQAKERLSRSTSTELTIPLLDVDAHLTREELEQVCAPLVERTIRVTQGVIRESGLAKEQVAGLFLVGAASRMPLVATLLHRELGIAPSAIEQPELAVSEGGLLAQHTISTPISVPSPALPPQTATPVAAVPAPETGRTMQLPHHSAPPSTSQPTPQSMPGSPPAPLTQPHPAAPPHPTLTGQYPAAPVPPKQDGPWVKSKQGVAVLASVAAVLVLAIGAIAVLQFLPDGKGDATDASGSEQSDSSAVDDAADSGDDSDGSASTGDDDGLVPIAEATTGDQVGQMAASHVGAVSRVRTGEVDGAPVVVTGGEDKVIRVWDIATGEEIGSFRGHKEPVEQLWVFEFEERWVAFSRDSSTEAVWYLDEPESPIQTRESAYNDIYWAGVWDSVPVYLTEYNVVQVFNGQEMSDQSMTYADFNAIAELNGELVQAGVYENTVFVADPVTSEPIGGTFDQLGVEVTAFTAGTAAGKVLGVTVTADGSVQAWDLATAKPYGTAGRDLVQAVVGVQLIELDGKPVALLLGDQGLTMFDLDTGAQIGETVAPHSGEDAITSADVAVVDGHDVVVTGSGMGDVQGGGVGGGGGRAGGGGPVQARVPGGARPHAAATSAASASSPPAHITEATPKPSAIRPPANAPKAIAPLKTHTNSDEAPSRASGAAASSHVCVATETPPYASPHMAISTPAQSTEPPSTGPSITDPARTALIATSMRRGARAAPDPAAKLPATPATPKAKSSVPIIPAPTPDTSSRTGRTYV